MSSVMKNSRVNLITYLRAITSSEKFINSGITIDEVARPREHRSIGYVRFNKSYVSDNGKIRNAMQTVYMGKIKNDSWYRDADMSYKYAMNEGFEDARYCNSVSKAVTNTIDAVEKVVERYKNEDRANAVIRYQARQLADLFEKDGDLWYPNNDCFDRELYKRLVDRLNNDPVLFVDWNTYNRKAIGRHSQWSIRCEREPVNGEARFTISYGRYMKNNHEIYSYISARQVKRAISLEIHSLELFCSGRYGLKVDSKTRNNFPNVRPTISNESYRGYYDREIAWEFSDDDMSKWIGDCVEHDPDDVEIITRDEEERKNLISQEEEE